MTVERIPFGDRGLAEYGEPVNDTYRDRAPSIGTEIAVADSSSAEEPSCWLRLTGEAHLSGPIREHPGMPHGIAPGDVSAHLNVEKARQARDRLDAFITRQEIHMSSTPPVERVPAGAVVEAREMASGQVSPKTVLATVLPFVGTLLAVLVEYIVTGEFDTEETVTAITGAAASLAALLGAYAGKPGQVVVGTTVR